jgi:hypothetical protein
MHLAESPPGVHALRGKEFFEYDKPFVPQLQLGKFARNVSISTTIIGSFSGFTPISNEKPACRKGSPRLASILDGLRAIRKSICAS